MTWVPIFKVASVDFDSDLNHLRKIMGAFEKKVHFENGFKFSPEAEFAMGWWFYEIFVKIEFFKKLVTLEHNLDSKVKDERDILKIIQNDLKTNDSRAKVSLNSKPSVFQRYWTWLLR